MAATKKKTSRKSTTKPSRSKARPKESARPKKPASKPAKAKAKARTVEIERFVRATPPEVWKLLSTPEGLAKWIGTTKKLDLEPGSKFDVTMKEGHATANKVVAVDAGRSLEIDWETTARWGPTRVAFTLAAEKGGTRLRLVQSGFGDGPEWDEWYESFDGGWAGLVAALVTAAERSGTRSCEMQAKLAAKPSDVFAALSSPAGLGRWFSRGPGKLESKRDGRYELACGPTTIAGRVREHSRDRTIALEWTKEPCTELDLPLPTVVTFHLTPLKKGGTCVTLVHSGFGDGPEWDAIYKRHAETWKFLLSNLKSVVDHGVDKRSRSIERSLLIAREPEDVFALFSTQAGFARWLSPSVEVDARVGGAVRFGRNPADTWPIVELDPGKRIVLTGAAGGSPKYKKVFGKTLTEITVEPAPGGARLRIVESGFGSGPEWDEWYKGALGWDQVLGTVHTALEGHGKKSRAIERTFHVAAAPELVWSKISTSEGITSFWAEGTIDAREGGVYQFAHRESARGQVRQVVSERALSFTWDGNAAGKALPAETLVTFRLEPEGEGTSVTLHHSGFGEGAAWDEGFECHDEGWTPYLENLVTLLDKVNNKPKS